jgi:hypothetical protein
MCGPRHTAPVGIWKDAWVAPERATLPDVDAFGRFVVDLAHERVVRTPWTLIAGRVDVNQTLLWSDAAVWQAVCGDPLTDARVLAEGDAVGDVPSALRQAPYGTEDVALIFDSLDFGNPRILEHYWYDDHRTVLVCYALAPAQARYVNGTLLDDDLGGPTHDVQVCVVNTFKFGEHEPCPAITDVVRRHFGSALEFGVTLH